MAAPASADDRSDAGREGLHRPARTHRIAELTAPEVAARLTAGACAILPMGSLETHGPQAPMGDFLLAEAIADRIAAAAAAAGADALVLPAIPFGGEDYFGFTSGGVVLTPGLLQAVIEEVCGNLLRTGARRLLIVNGHAGSIGPVDAAARMLCRRHDVVIPALHLWRAAGALHAEFGGPAASLGHGGDPVWSVALHLRPDLCRPELARAREAGSPVLGLPAAGLGAIRLAGVEFAVPMEVEAVAPGGVACADSRPGTAAHGARITARLVEAGAAMISQMKAATP
ncbi:MAG: Creatinine amidohydrolase [Belnapia sp.]|nr:Creatinine amidohydrolase [Belnapia sp.]